MMLKTPIKQPPETSDLVTAFQEGDLLYGLEKEARSDYRMHIINKFANKNLELKYLTVDDINKDLSEKTIYSATEKSTLASTEKDLETIVSTHFENWIRHKKYSTSLIHATKNQHPSDLENKFFKDSCKVALLTHEKTIHFCLDGLKLEAIRDRSHPQYKSFTSRELRLCAKNWTSVEHRVHFYYDGARCEAPWLGTEPKTWLEANLDLQTMSVNSPASFFATPQHTPQKPHAGKIPQSLADQFGSPDEQSTPSTESPGQSPTTRPVSKPAVVQPGKARRNLALDINSADDGAVNHSTMI